MSETARPLTLRAASSALTVDPQGRLRFRLDGKHRWEAGALCILHYYDRQHPRAQQVPVPWDTSSAFGTAGTLSLSARSRLELTQQSDTVLQAVATFDSIDVRITLRIELCESGEGFDVTIGPDDVHEGMPHLYRVLQLELLPEFGAARTGEQGYLTLPNWYGCQTNFTSAYPREVRQTIYSSNDQWEYTCNAPVFGITRAQGTLCGLVAQGDYDAQLVCRRHWEAQQANSVHPSLVWRWEQQDERIEGPRQVRYRFAAPDSDCGEGYAFVGVQYRRFLRTDRNVHSWEQKRTFRPQAVEYAQRFFLKIFMAYKDPHPQGQGEYHCTTTCDEVIEILRRCLEGGMRKLSVILVGWGQDGHDGKCPTYLPVDERVGGNEKMREVIAFAREHDIQLGVHTSHGGAYTCSDEFNVDDLVRHRSGEYWESVIWSGGQAHRVCPAVSLEKLVKRDVPALHELGFYGHHHYDAVGGFMCCWSPLHPVTQRGQYIALQRKEFEVAIDVMGSVSTEMPFGQYFDVVDGFFHSYSRLSAWFRNCAVGQHFCDRVVPMLGIALHGSHKCAESIGHGKDRTDEDRMVDLLDLGLAPQYEVCMRPSPAFGIPSYDKSADLLANAYRFAFGPDGYMDRLTMHDIESRTEPLPGVTCTRYSDGTVVTVNRSEADFDGVPGGGWRMSPERQ